MSKFEKMEQALDEIGNACAWIAENCNDEQTAKYMLDLVEKVKAALEEPKRNCDVGTAEEQYKRFQDFCLHNSFRGVCSVRCPLYTQCTIGSYQTTGRAICFPAWSQMPYEADTEKEGSTR